LIFYTGSRNQLASQAVAWKEVDEGWIRYDLLSGRTHLLNPLARFVIEVIEDSSLPLPWSTIVERVLSTEQDADPVDCQVEVQSVLQILLAAQLIESIQR
jgi:hypothetical protein